MNCGDLPPLKMFSANITSPAGYRNPVVYSDKPAPGSQPMAIATILILATFVAFIAGSSLLLEVLLGVAAAIQTGRILIQKFQLAQGRKRSRERL